MSATDRRRIALLRGINVGRAKRIAMADLRALVEGLGYGDVRTLLNSGNVVFTLPARSKGDPAARIEQALVAELGVPARVALLEAAELAEVVARNPLRARFADPSRALVAVPYDAQGRKLLAPLAKRDWKPDALALGARVAYLWCPGGLLESELAKHFLGPALRDVLTTRNWATIQKLDALAQAPG